MGKIFFSIIIPVLNAVETIEIALKSVFLDNNRLDYEVIIVDGGSTDGTLEIIEKYSKFSEYSKYLKIIDSKGDGGAHFAVNNGLNNSNGEVIVLLCADDYLEPGILDIIFRKFSSNPNLEILNCGITILDNKRKIIKSYLKEEDLEFSINKLIEHPLSHGRIIRKRLYHKFNGFPTDYSLCNDLFFFLKIIFESNVNIDYLEINAYNYIAHDKSATLGSNKNKLFQTYVDGYLISNFCLQKYSQSLKISNRISLYNLHFKSLFNIFLNLKYFEINNSRLNYNVIFSIKGMIYIPLLLFKYIIEKCKI